MVLKNSKTRRKQSLPLASKQVQNTSYILIRLCSKDGCYRNLSILLDSELCVEASKPTTGN